MPEYGESTDTTQAEMLADIKSVNGEEDADAQADLEANIRYLFDRSVSNVQAYSSKFQQAYITPAYAHAKVLSGTYPVLTLYIGLYSAFGLIPVVLFLCFSAFILVSSVIVALTLAIAFSVSIISAFGLLLFCTLFWTSLVSLAATVLVIAGYQLTRLVVIVREAPTWQAGVRKWISVLKDFGWSRLPNGHRELVQRVGEPVMKTESNDT